MQGNLSDWQRFSQEKRLESVFDFVVRCVEHPEQLEDALRAASPDHRPSDVLDMLVHWLVAVRYPIEE